MPVPTPASGKIHRACLTAILSLLLMSGNTTAGQRGQLLSDLYIGGTVASVNGPEAGVWVIAETSELQTPFIKIVVTDDHGSFVLPQMPEATYKVWVRGYGLVDSKPVKSRPGDHMLQLTAIPAANPQEAAAVYPADYWLSLLKPPAPDQFPGTGPQGNGVAEALKDQTMWLNDLKSNCHLCHQLGSKITRSLEHMDHFHFKSPEEAWDYRTQLGVRGSFMYAAFNMFGRENAMHTFADWTSRIKAGAVPVAPPRPNGIERNLVLTLWEWGVPTSFMHDEITTDKNDPSVNAYGPVFAVSSGHGKLTEVDPVLNTTRELLIPTRDDPRGISSRFPPPVQPSNFWGNEHLWGQENPADPHNPMMDHKGRVWLTSKIREQEPAWCMQGSSNKFAQYYPLKFSPRQASYYDPATGGFTLIDTCFATHHLQFATDADQTLYFNELLGPVIGWINTRQFDLNHDKQAAQGWCPQVLDTSGDGRITKPWNQPGGKFDPRLDTEVRYNLYSVIPNPADDSVWGASEEYPGYLIRLVRGDNPPTTCMTELYKVPKPGFDPRGIDIDSKGLVWAALAGSSHLASFDRRKCKVLNGPATRDGTQCDAGWTFYRTDGPRLQGTDVPADFHYFGWVDRFNTAGLGYDVPFATGSNSDSLLALDPRTGKWTRLRVPYPLGFYHRGMDGRIDDPAAGWKGRGLWANYGTHLMWHVEGGKGTRGKMVHFQLRPDPLAH